MTTRVDSASPDSVAPPHPQPKVHGSTSLFNKHLDAAVISDVVTFVQRFSWQPLETCLTLTFRLAVDPLRLTRVEQEKKKKSTL